MRWLLSIYYWTVGLGFFAPLLVSLLIRSFLQSPHEYDAWLRLRLRSLFKLLNSDPQVSFAEPLPQGAPLIFMANHSSLVDIPLLKAVIPQYFLGIIAEDQLNYPLYGTVVKRIGNIPISRNNIRGSIHSFQRAKQTLAKGIQITVLPEGGRSLDGRLIPFKRLVFRFAKESGAHVVPVSISGVFKMKNKGSFNLRPGKIVVRFGPILRAEDMADMSLDDILDTTKRAISSGLEPFEAGISSLE